jgi:hypothetical protein
MEALMNLVFEFSSLLLMSSYVGARYCPDCGA